MLTKLAVLSLSLSFYQQKFGPRHFSLISTSLFQLATNWKCNWSKILQIAKWSLRMGFENDQANASSEMMSWSSTRPKHERVPLNRWFLSASDIICGSHKLWNKDLRKPRESKRIHRLKLQGALLEHLQKFALILMIFRDSFTFTKQSLHHCDIIAFHLFKWLFRNVVIFKMSWTQSQPLEIDSKVVVAPEIDRSLSENHKKRQSVRVPIG